MKKRYTIFYVLFIILDAIALMTTFYINSTYYSNIYNTSIITGILLFLLISFIVALIQHKQCSKLSAALYSLCLALCLAAYIIFLPAYTPESALKKVQNDTQFIGYAVSPDAEFPIEGSAQKLSLFVGSGYKFVAVSKDTTYDIWFNPVSGEYYPKERTAGYLLK